MPIAIAARREKRSAAKVQTTASIVIPTPENIRPATSSSQQASRERGW